ncbi:DNA-binding response regulator [Paenibacillus sp. FSL H7-0326]|uniref:response regulator transcription factor n=1 Tax=Paenibacillus sp. FSL H7-0326 TaxID=1921144 RepID=UPI00096E6E9F|nr:response regulator [Paenibacillus sp. FSL H7-0326]OMC67469.1 DNA-binding response regulator [Paenibacillus sp. FSL H7-0326]
MMKQHSLIRLCIIDDIRSVVEMIARKPPWEEFHIEVIGTALDGEEGIQLVKEMKPDIVLTDIRMPKKDGLAMTQEILEYSPSTKIVILSAYTDFSYTRQAIRLGAFDFIKKPFSIDEIVQVVLKAKSAYLEDRQKQSQVMELKQNMFTSLPVLQQEYLSLLVHHHTNSSAAYLRWQSLGITLKPRFFNLFIVEMDRFMGKYKDQPAREVELIRFSLRNILEETIKGFTEGIVFSEALNRFVCLFNCEEMKVAEQIAGACQKNMYQFTHSTISIGIGMCVTSIDELPNSYETALNALEYHFYANGVNSYRSDDEKTFWSYTESTEQELLFALRSGHQEKCRLILEQIFNDILQLDPLPKPQQVENICYELSSKICRVMSEQFSQDRVKRLEEKWNAVKRSGLVSFQILRETVKEICLEACSWIEEERSDESTKLIYQAKEFICSNLHKNLTLDICSKQFNISPGYFSNLFKKVLNITFQQFVMHQRMEKAKEMLINDYQVQEIAQELGYEHRRYFSEVFKKHTNMTPSEFKLYSTGRVTPPIEQ